MDEIRFQKRFSLAALLLLVSAAIVGCNPGKTVPAEEVATQGQEVVIEDNEAIEYDESPPYASGPLEKLYKLGPSLYEQCKECHTLDGTPSIGPSWKGLWERAVAGTIEFTDGTTLADHMGPDQDYISPEDFIMRSMMTPRLAIHAGFEGEMPTFRGQLSTLEIQAFIDFMKNLDKFDADGKLLPGADE